MKRLILTYCHYMGWGDSMISIHDILSCAKYIRENHKDFEIYLIINDIRNNGVELVLQEVFDLDYFNNFFDKFSIQTISFEEFNNFGNLIYDGIKYKRIYSGRNYDYTNNTPGIFDVYVNIDSINEFENLKIPFEQFTFDDIVNVEIEKFPIFNVKLINKVEEFISNNFNEKFYGICYRSGTDTINYENLKIVKNIINEKFDIGKQYFLCSNSSECKQQLQENGLNIKLFRNANEHPRNHILDGFPSGENKITDSFYSVCEMLILSKSEKIYYSGEMGWISYFTWYSQNVEKKEINIINQM